jgi:MFS family permease
MGYFGAVFGVTNVAGPLLGGLFTQHLTWRWIFYINVPIGIVALFVIAAVLHIPTYRVQHTIDWAGISLLSAGVTIIILMTTWGGSQYRWGSPTIIGMALVSVALLVGFCIVETKVAEPIIPLSLFRSRTFSSASGVGFIVGFAMFGAIVYLPLYLQTVHGASPTASGLELLPMVAGMLLTFIVSGRLVTRTGRYKVFPIAGSAVLTVGLALLSRLGPHTSFSTCALYMVVVGLGLGLVMQVLVVAVQNAVPYSQMGVATSTATFFRTIGGAFGVSALGAVFNSRLLHQLTTHATAAQLTLLHGGNVAANPAQINHLPTAQRIVFVDAFSHALQTVFVVAVPFTLLACVLSFIMKEIPLRTTAQVPVADGVDPAVTEDSFADL